MMLWINLVGIALIVLIVWWFWLYKEHNISIAEGSLEVLVKDGIYQPAHIKIRANEERQIVFHRADATPCAEMLSIPDGGFAMNRDPIIGAKRLISTLTTLRNATRDEATLEGLRDALSDAIGGIVQNLEHEISTMPVEDSQ